MDEQTFSYANLSNALFLDGLYRDYLQNPEQVDPSWRNFFAGMEFAKGSPNKEGGEAVKVLRLIEAYKKEGHKQVLINPIEESKKADLPLSQFGLSEADLEKEVPTFGVVEEPVLRLSQLIKVLQERFCNHIGFELGDYPLPIQQITGSISNENRLQILDDLLKAELFEAFIHKKYPGQTRFSLEGAETLIPMLNFLLRKAADMGVEQVILGMPHRGRLNVLVNVLQMPYAEIFRQFNDELEEDETGDVKYHKGAEAVIEEKIQIELVPNPSHLESVDPVVLGKTRAKQEEIGSTEKILPVLIHGDAALAGQGVVYEALQMSKLPGYSTGGTIHIVVNNHIGYTTLPEESRSTFYCTDIAKAFGFPVFHVNAEDPEQCIAAIFFALYVRKTFRIDVFIDMGCYRKYGHNEGDEPSFTQPLEYQKIHKKPWIRSFLEASLIDKGVLSAQQVSEQENAFMQKLEEICSQKDVANRPLESEPEILEEPPPAISESILKELAEKISQIPEGFHIHPKLMKLYQERGKMTRIDWGLGEQLAYATLLKEGITIRISGQDVCRGTFSHRHAVLVDQQTAERYTPLNHLFPQQALCNIYNSPLSEFAVMGFDLGYSQAHSHALVIWEAQFGDFVNGAQIIIDQYLTTCEQKWNHPSNLTLFLPHGYEGKGPEHSSARMERFLQLAAEDNMVLANCTTPAQLFHILRKQAHLKCKMPLILFTPKLLLRHPQCVSSLQDLTKNRFSPCLEDPVETRSATKILLCSGKIFYDLLEEREKRQAIDIAIIRIEQLYPFPEKDLEQHMSQYARAQQISWVQEEPQNMGAWHYMQRMLKNRNLRYIGRKESASPATGSYRKHKKEYESLMHEVFEGE